MPFLMSAHQCLSHGICLPFCTKKKGFILLAEDIIIIAGGTSAIFVTRSNRENGLGEQSLYSTQDIVYVRML